MRWAVALVCAGLIFSAQAQTVTRIITPTPVSVALTVGQWLFKDQKKLYYIEVQSRAPTFEQAQQEGFRLAVEHAVGSVILSETDVKHGVISRDEIIVYSSGYVDNFEIVQRDDQSNGVILSMRIWVSHSAIANRLLNQSTTATTVDGERSAVQINTLTQTRQAGDRVLQTVLADFPRRSFDIQVESTRVVYSSQRTGQLHVRFYLSWNKQYLNSLAEALVAIDQKSQCNSIFKRCRYVNRVEVKQPGFTKNTVAWFDDAVIWDIFQKQTIGTQPTILIDIKDFNRTSIFKQCFRAKELDHSDWNSWYYVEMGPGQVIVHGNQTKRYDIFIDLQQIPVDKLNNIELTTVTAKDC